MNPSKPQPQPGAPHPAPGDPKSARRTGTASWWRRLGRGLLLLGLSLFLLVCGLGLYLKFFFPIDSIRPLLERKLSDQLKMPVRIGGLDLDLWNGFGLRQLTLGGPEPLFSMDELVLDYRLADLLQGRLTIDRIQIEHPRAQLIRTAGAWNFQPLLELGAPADQTAPVPEPAPEPAPTGAEPPPIPLAIDLREFSIRNIEASVRMDDGLALSLMGLDLEAEGRADAGGVEARLRVLWRVPAGPEDTPNLTFESTEGPGLSFQTRLSTDLTLTTPSLQQAVLQGTVRLQNNRLRAGRALPAPDLVLTLDADVNRDRQTAALHRLTLNIGRDNQIELAATVSDLEGEPRFRGRLRQARFDLAELTALGREFLPPLEASGRLLLENIVLSGVIPKNGKPDLEVPEGRVRLQDLALHHPESGVRLTGAGLDLTLKEVLLPAAVPQQARVGLHLQLREAALPGGLRLEGLNQQFDFQGRGPLLEQTEVQWQTRLDRVALNLPEIGPFQTGVTLAGAAKGNFPAGDLELTRLTFNLGEVLQVAVKGSARHFGQKDFDAREELHIDLEQALGWVPEQLRTQLGLSRLEGKVAIDVHSRGTLDARFQPAALQADTRLALNHIHARLDALPLAAKDLNLTLDLPAGYDPARGVFIPRLEARAGLDGLSALDTWEVGPTETVTTVETDRHIALSGAMTPVSLKHDSRLRVERITGSNPKVRLTGFESEVSTRARLHSLEDVRDLVVKLKTRLESTAALDQVQAGALSTEVTVQTPDLKLEDVRVTVATALNGASYRQDDLHAALDSLRLEHRSRLNLKTGAVHAEHMLFDVPGWMRLQASGEVAEWGERFDLKAAVTGIDFAHLLARVPERFREPVADLALSGQAALELKASGTRPTPEQIRRLDLPVRLSARAEVRDTSVSWPSQQLQVSGLNTRSTLESAGDRVTLAGHLDFGAVAHASLPENQAVHPRLRYRLALDGGNRLKVEEIALDLDDGAAELALTGQVEGFRPFLTGGQAPALPELMRRLDAGLETRLTLQAGPLSAHLPEWQADGALRSSVGLLLVAGREVRVRGEIGFDHLNARQENALILKNLDGRFPFDKRLLLDRQLLEPSDSEFSVSRKGFFNLLRDFSAHKNILTADALAVGTHSLKDIGLDVYFRDDRLSVEKFLFQTLGAGIGGNLFLIQTERGPELSFGMEFANMDFNALVPDSGLASSAETRMDGNVHLLFQAGRGGAEGRRIDLDQLSLDARITRIGRDVLDRCLVFLDPDESKPAIVDTRARLKLASPHRVQVGLENGNLSLAVSLYNKMTGGILNAPELRRVPVTRLKPFREINEQLQVLGDFQEALAYLSARGIEFDEAGNPKPF